MTKTLVSSRLTLNSTRPDDIQTVFELCQDPEIQRWTPVPSPYRLADAEFFVNSYVPHGEASGNFTVWAIRSDDTAPMLGMIELRPDATQGSASLGCWLGAPWRGQGVMTEALTTVIGYAFAPSGGKYERLRWEALEGNKASYRLARRLGFVFNENVVRTLEFRDESRPGLLAVLSAVDYSRNFIDHQ